jgi:hypothetical protein
MPTFKETVKTLLPPAVVKAIVIYRLRNRIKRYNRGLTTKEVFTKIYKEGFWGQSDDPADEYHSGSGSRDRIIVESYVNAVGQFLRSFEKKPNVVDVGCGDFAIGSQVRPFCGDYVACDIVEPLIEFNKGRYTSLNVDFKVLDLTKDSLPQGDVLFLRQVLQHLSNKQIKAALPEISRKFKFLVLTEHLPASESFRHNLDIPSGPMFRVPINSGVVLTSPPFNLSVKEETVLCQRAEHGGIIKTILFRL